MYNFTIKKKNRKRRKTYNDREKRNEIIYIYLNRVKTEKNKKTLRNYQIEKLTI